MENNAKQQHGSGRNLFSVHVANVPCGTEEEDLRDIFSTLSTEEQPEIYIAPKIRPDSKFIYAFIRYRSPKEAENACRTFNGVKMGYSKLLVTLSNDTRERLSGCAQGKSPRNRGEKGIIRSEMPRFERTRFTVLASDERLIHQRLKANLSGLTKNTEMAESLGVNSKEDVKEFMTDLRDVLVSIADVPFGVAVDPIRYGAEEMKKTDIKDLIIRYHDSVEREVPFKDVDVDISGNNLLTDEQMTSLFPCLSSAHCLTG